MPFRKSKQIVKKSKKIVKKGKRKHTTRKLKKRSIKRGGGQGSSRISIKSPPPEPSRASRASKASKASKSKPLSVIEEPEPIPKLSTIKSASSVPSIPIFKSKTIPDLSNIKTIEPFGPPSNNGFLYQVTTDNNMNAILKSTQTLEQEEGFIMKPDNLFYEYLVGQYINTLINRFPCFLQTYGLYKYENQENYEKMKDKTSINNTILPSLQEVIVNYRNLSDTLNIACKNDNHMAILLQYLPNITSMRDMLEKKKEFIKRDLITSLYQIYFVLNLLQDTFTHYDLHDQNVQLYEVPSGKYIQYRYHLPSGKVVSFKSKYLVKIIDYSRCYFVDKSNSSINVNDNLNNADDCIDTDPSGNRMPGGYNYGFQWLIAPEKLSDTNYIHSTKRNLSHDLRLLQVIKELLEINDTEEKQKQSILHKLLSNVYYETEFGTPEIYKKIEGKRIVNVSNAENALNQIITSKNNDKYDNAPESSELLCTLEIYSDGSDMQMTLPA